MLDYEALKVGNIVSLGSVLDMYGCSSTPKTWIVIDVNKDKRTFILKEEKPNELELVLRDSDAKILELVSEEGPWMAERRRVVAAESDVANVVAKLSQGDVDGALRWAKSALEKLRSR